MKLFTKLTQAVEGRHTLFALFFSLSATMMAWFHRLDGNYIAFVTVMQGWVFAHSYKEDLANKGDKQ